MEKSLSRFALLFWIFVAGSEALGYWFWREGGEDRGWRLLAQKLGGRK